MHNINPYVTVADIENMGPAVANANAIICCIASHSGKCTQEIGDLRLVKLTRCTAVPYTSEHQADIQQGTYPQVDRAVATMCRHKPAQNTGWQCVQRPGSQHCLSKPEAPPRPGPYQLAIKYF